MYSNGRDIEGNGNKNIKFTFLHNFFEQSILSMHRKRKTLEYETTGSEVCVTAVR